MSDTEIINQSKQKKEKRCQMMEGAKSTKGPDSSVGKNKGSGGICTIFMHADTTDMWLMTFGILGAVGDGLSTPIMLLLIGKIMNSIGSGASSSSLSTADIDKNVLNVLYVACGSFVASFIEGYCWTRTGAKQATRMRSKYLKAILRQDIEYFDLNGASMADVITSVSSDSLIIQDVLSEKVPNFITNCTSFFGSFIIGFIRVWRLASALLPTVVLLIIPGLMYGRILTSLAQKIQKEFNKAGAIIEQAISSIRTVYSFVMESKTMTEFTLALESSVKLGIYQGLIKGITMGSNSITYAIWTLVALYGTHLIINHTAQGGDIFATGYSVVNGGLAFGMGLSNVKYFAEAISASDRIVEVIKRVPKIDSESTRGESLESVSGELEFREVEFSYPSRPMNQILKDFNLKVPAGQTMALVGSSGSGKSTVVALLERFYDPDKGEILLDGINIRKLNLKWLREQMGLVSQEPALFAMSIKENILFGKEDASVEEVVAAAKASNAHDFISQLPQGYDTQVGERGLQMSGGQKQRIAIARAIVRSPKILLLDEATSALDSESEQIVQDALDLASVGRTTVMVAHRLSTIRNAAIIMVVQDGRIIEKGSHDNLMCNEDGLYPSLIRLQQATIAKEEQGESSSRVAALEMEPSTSKKISQGFSSVSPCSPTRHFHNIAAVAGREPCCQSSEQRQYLSVPSFCRMFLLSMPEWKYAAIGCFNAFIVGGIQPFSAFTMGSLTSTYFLRDQNEIKKKTTIHSLIFLFISIFSFLTNIGQHYSFGVTGEYLTKQVRHLMLSKMLAFEVGWFDQEENSPGAIYSQFANDAYMVKSLVGDRMSLLIQTFSAIMIAFTMGLIIAWRLALVMIATQPIVILCFYYRKALLKSMSKDAVKGQSESSKVAAEAISNLRTVTAFSSQDRILRLFDLAQQGFYHQSMCQSWLAGIVLGLSQCLMRCTFALALWYGSRLTVHGYITPKSLFQTYLILVTTGRVIADAGSMTTDLAKGTDAISSIFSILDRVSQIEPEDPNGSRPEKLSGKLEFLNVDFEYPARPNVIVLKGFSLLIEAGKSTALVGKSGSGKSTIIGLIERFYDPFQGEIKIDGRNIKSYHLRSLRRHIALVEQEPMLFSGSIKENIAYGIEGVMETEVEEAARAANAHDFICGLKDGYDTLCGDRGVQLSGGQKQRIAIARAILKRPTILLLDEATSALDSESEKKVKEALERVMERRTSIIVAHRLSSIQNCDLIAVLDKGVMVEEGNHRSLLDKGPSGFYYRLLKLQQNTKECI